MLTHAKVLSPRGRARTGRLLALLVGLLLPLLAHSAVARADVHGTLPAANATLSRSPQRVVIPAAGASGAGTITVLDANRRRVASTAGRVHDGALAGPLPKLGRGVYTVAWHAPGASPARGTFAFSVGAAPALVDDSGPAPALNPLWMGLPRFFAFALEMTMIGTLALWILVTRPALAEYGPDARSVTGPIQRRLLQLAAVSGVLFIPAYLAQLVVESSDPDVNRGFWAMIRPGDVWSFLTRTPDGHVWEARLLLAVLAAALLAPAAGATLRRGHVPRTGHWRPGTARDRRIVALALSAGVGELLARVIPTETPPDWAREIFTQLLDFGHLASASVWVGGLIALTVLAVSVRGVSRETPSLWGVLLRRFSLVATVCVGVVVLTGLWTYWIHVGPPRLLVHTLYGETLLVKLLLVTALLGLGAVNQLWLAPRVRALRAGGTGGSALSLTLRHFRGVVAVEAALGLAVLFVVPQLAGSARNQAFQARGGALTTVARAGDISVSLSRSGTQPGIVDYDLSVPGANGRAVEMSFSMPQFSVPATTVTATALGGDRYRVSGMYAATTGPWQAAVRVGAGQVARFALPVTATAPPPAKAPPPGIRVSTWIWGAGWVLAVLVVLGGAGVASRRSIRRQGESRAERQPPRELATDR